VAHASGVADHLVAHWAFDETVAGSNAEDSVGSNDGVPTNDPAPSTDVPSVSFDDARSASFNGSNYFTFDRPVSTDFTVCAWVKTTSTGGGVNHWTSAPILDSETGGVAYDLGFGVGNGGKLMFGNGGLVDGNLVDRQVNGTTTINDDAWHNVCATRNNSNGEVDLYVDAKLDGSGTTGTGPLTSNAHARVGYGYDGAALFQGLIDDVRIYDVVLTTDQLTNLTDGSGDPDTPPEPPLAPTVTPADDATGVAIGSNLTLAFNRAPTAGTGNIEIHRANDDSTVATIAADDTDRVSISGSTVTVNPAANLNASTAYYVLVDADAFKDSDGDFYAGISDPTAWSFTTAAPAATAPTSSENDGDGIDESVEAAAPNNGDANDDGVPDSAQPNVSSFPNPGTGGYVSVAVNTDCTLSNVGMSSLRSGAGDDGFTYPVGLVDFTASCAAASTVVTVYFNDPPDGDLVVRKYDPSTNTFTSVDNAKLTRTTVGGKPVAVASYVVVDGGPLDSDHVVNGSVVDPVGLAQAVEASPAASPAPAGTTPAAPAAPAAGTDELPYTGAKAVHALTVVAAVLATAGLLMLLAARRRRDDLRAEASESA
jgi:LPXTG-motif cell wall-anchored protein